jgi:hypothetical protein
MATRSLLQRAREYRKAAGSEGSATSEFIFDKSSGISKEDQQDILLHIDHVAKSSRILAGPETWKFKTKRRGLMLPIVVNVVGLLVLSGGIYGLGRLFSVDKKENASGTAMITSAEGKLLQEIKREAEGQIQQKDQEIASIQQQMAALDREKDQLLSSVEARVKAKETELRDQLNVELERERQRLIAEGLSESTIQQRLKEFERKKSEEFNAQLADFSKKAESERIALQANLDKARDEYRKSLSDATSERQRIQDEARSREQALREQLNAKDQALEAERSRTAESLRTAQAELAKFNEDATRSKATEDRLLGLYASARQSLNDGRLDDATKTLEALRSYLSDTQVNAIPSLRARRELDLFTMSLIERTIGTERAKSGADTSRISAALDALSSIRIETERARAALAAGKPDVAAAAYRKALGATRELEEAGTFLDEYWKAAVNAQSSARDTDTRTRTTNVQAALAAIDAAGKDEKALSEAFARLMAAVPVDPELAARAYARIKEAAVAQAETAKRVADTSSAAAPLQSAAAALSDNRYLEAIAGYASILSRYPSAGQSPQAIEGLRLAGRNLADAFEAYRNRTADRIAKLEADLAGTRVRITELDAKLTTSQSENADLRAAAARVPAGTGTATTAVTGASSAQLQALQAEKAELERQKTAAETELAAAKARYDKLTTAYRDYAVEEDRILGTRDAKAYIDGRTQLDSFLSSAPVSAAMPGMRDRIATYLSAFQAAGLEEVLFNAAGIVDGAIKAARGGDTATRTRYFQDQEKLYARNPSMLDFLKSVKDSFR